VYSKINIENKIILKLLFFASDYKIGLSSLLTDQIIALNKYTDLEIFGVAGEKMQEFDLDKRFKKNDIYIKRISGLDDHKNFFRLKQELTKFIQKQQIDLIHVQNNWQLLLVGLIKYLRLKHKRIKIIYTIHGFRHNHYLKSLLARLAIGILMLIFTDKIIYMSDYVVKKFRLISYKMVKIFLGVNEDFLTNETYSIDINRLKLIFPAQFRNGKNQDLLIHAFAQYCKETGDTSAELYLPGEGELKVFCQNLAVKLQVSDQIYFPGLIAKEGIREYYESCNIGIIPSNTETFGQSIIEPFVLGRCIITRKVGVAPDIIEEGINGFFFKNRSQLKDILIKISKDRSIIKEIGSNNFERRELFSWANSAQVYSTLLQDL
jgi:glycosyltransferase involved in cell wall biosynthesis